MNYKKSNSKDLINQNHIKADKYRKIFANVSSWLFSNLFAVVFPIGAIFFIETFKTNGHFSFMDNYSEMLMVSISICVNIIMQLNKNEYNINEYFITFIRVITTGILVVSSLAYGISKTIPQNDLDLKIVFGWSIILFIITFILGIACEFKKKWRN